MRAPILADRRMHVAVVVAMTLLAVICFWQTWIALVARWTALPETDGHGFLVVAVSLFLLVAYSLRQTAAPAADGRWLSIFATLGFGFAWLIAKLANVLVVESAVLPPMLFAAFCAALGFRAARTYAFPLAYLVFAMPVWGLVRRPLQEMTIAVNEWLLACLNVPALIDGALVHLPAGTFHIASGCAGLHFFVVAFALSALYAHLYLQSTRHAAVLIAVALGLAVVTNWIRVATIIYAGHVTNMQHYLVTVDHYYFGWYLFAAMLVPLFLLGRRLEAREQHDETVASGRDGLPPGSPQTSGAGIRFVAAAAAVAVFPMTAFALDFSSQSRPMPAVEMPRALGEWRWLEAPVPGWQPVFPGAESEWQGEYRTNVADLHVYVNRYTKQSQGRELIGTTSHLFDPASGVPSAAAIRQLDLANGGAVPVIVSTTLTDSGTTQVAYSWYWVGTQRYVRGIDVKLRELRSRLGGGAASGIIAIKVDCVDACDNEVERLERFVASYAGDLHQAVTGGGAQWAK